MLIAALAVAASAAGVEYEALGDGVLLLRCVCVCACVRACVCVSVCVGWLAGWLAGWLPVSCLSRRPKF